MVEDDSIRGGASVGRKRKRGPGGIVGNENIYNEAYDTGTGGLRARDAVGNRSVKRRKSVASVPESAASQPPASSMDVDGASDDDVTEQQSSEPEVSEDEDEEENQSKNSDEDDELMQSSQSLDPCESLHHTGVTNFILS
jgi:hypothetical protein